MCKFEPVESLFNQGKGASTFMDAIKKLSVMATSSEENSSLYVLSNCLEHILSAVIKLHRMIGVEMRVSILKEFYGDCSLEVEVYPHRETALSHNKVYEYFITFKKDNEKKSSSTTIGDGTHKGMTIKDLVFSDLYSLDIDNSTARELACIIQDTSNLEEGDLYTEKYEKIYNSYFVCAAVEEPNE